MSTYDAGYSLVLFRTDSGKILGQPACAFQEVRPITENEYGKFVEARAKVSYYSNRMTIYEGFYRNAKEFFATLRGIIKQGVTVEMPDDLMQASNMLEINRRLLNVLMLFRTYLDHTESELKRRYGEDSDRYKQFQMATANEYDSNFPYRFMYKLRNFAQHFDMPINGFSLHAEMVDSRDPSKGMQRGIKVEMSRDRLLETGFSWSVKLRKDIENLDETFNIVPIIHELVNCLLRIHMVVGKAEVEDVRPYAEFLTSLAEEAGGLDCQIGVCQMLKEDDSEPIINMMWIPTRTLFHYWNAGDPPADNEY